MEGRLPQFLVVRGLIDILLGWSVGLYLAAFIWDRWFWWSPGFDVLSLASLGVVGTYSLAVGFLASDRRMQRRGLLWSSALSVLLGGVLVASFFLGGTWLSTMPIPTPPIQGWWVLMLPAGSVLIETGACGFLITEPSDASPAPAAAAERVAR